MPLPTQFENTAETWRNMPGMAAYFTGLQNKLAEQNTGLLQGAFASEQNYKAKERPILLENLVKSGQLTEAQARHARALAASNEQETGEKLQTQPGRIAATNAESTGKISKSEVEQGENEARKHGIAASWLETYGSKLPPTMAAQEVIKQLGIKDPNGEIAARIAQNIQVAPQLLRKHAEEVWKTSATARDRMMQEEGDTKRTNISAGATIKAAEISANARLQVQALRENSAAKSISEQAASGKLSWEKTAAAYRTLALVTEDKDKAQEYMAEAERYEKAVLAKAAAGITGKLELNSMGIQTQKPQLNLGPAKTTSDDPLEGRTATNDKGEKIIRKNGQWVPM